MSKVRIYFPIRSKEECVEISIYGDMTAAMFLYQYLKGKGVKTELVTITEHVQS